MNRRDFIRLGVTTLGGLSHLPWLQRSAEAVPRGKKILVVIFQRGASDGLSMVPPIGDSNYAAARPNIAIPETGEGASLDLKNGFALHPSLSPLKRYWDEGTLSIVHQVASPHLTRSHFDAQDFLESGTPGKKSTEDGYLNRALQSSEQFKNDGKLLQAVAIGADLPRSLWGSYPAIALNNVKDFSKAGLKSPKVVSDFESMYRNAVDTAFRGAANEGFDALRRVAEAQSKGAEPAPEKSYPEHQLGKRLKELALLIKADLGVRIAAVDCGAWDTHANQGGSTGALAKNLDGFASSIGAFAQDMGARFQDLCVVTLTEFGRTVKQNGTRGTDHGHGSVMFVLGGGVKGRQLFEKWKPLSESNLFEGRDLMAHFDHREILGEVLTQHLGIRNLSTAFPDFRPGNRLKLFG